MPRWCRIHFLLFAAQLDGLKITFFVKNNNKMKNSFLPKQKCKPFLRLVAWTNVIGRHFSREEADHWQVRLIGFRVFVGWRNLSSQLHPPPNSPCWWATITRQRTFLSAHVRVHYTHTHTPNNSQHTHTQRYRDFWAINFWSRTFSQIFLVEIVRKSMWDRMDESLRLVVTLLLPLCVCVCVF